MSSANSFADQNYLRSVRPVICWALVSLSLFAWKFHQRKSREAVIQFSVSIEGRKRGPIYTAKLNDIPFQWQGAFGIQTDPNGLFYMRARHYHPWLGRFISEDPLRLAAGPNFFSYASGNPIMLNDPTDNYFESPWDAVNIGIGVGSLGNNLRDGNYKSAAVDLVGLAYDTAATAIPFLPAGASAGVKAYRAGNTLVDSVNAGLDVARVTDHVDDAARAVNIAKQRSCLASCT